MEPLRPRIVFILVMGWFKVEKARLEWAEHTQIHPPPYTWFHIGFLDTQFPGPVIYGTAKATNRISLGDGLV